VGGAGRGGVGVGGVGGGEKEDIVAITEENVSTCISAIVHTHYG